MASNLTLLADGRTAFVYDSLTLGVPWHGLGEAQPQAFMIPWAVKRIGADFQAQGNSVHRRDGTKIPGWKEIAHPTGATYQVATENYEIVNYEDLAASFATAAGETPDNPRGNTMGMIGDDMGQFFVTCESALAKINKKNEIKRFMCFMTGHAGVISQIFGTDVNIVCQNTLNAGLRLARGQAKNYVKVAHKTGANRRIELMAGMITVAQQIDALALEAYVALAETLVDRPTVESYASDLFPHDKEKGPTPDRILDKRLAVEQAFAHPVVHGTKTGSDGRSAFGLLNAATWWIDHNQAKGDWARTAFSPACHDSRQRAFDLAVALVRA